MDVTALLVFVSGFVVCAGAVFLISIVGAKEETYEEAIEKQKKANEKEKKSKDKKKENENKKTKNWRMKKKGEKDDKHDGLDEVEEEQVVLVPKGAKIEDVVDPVPVPEVAPETPPAVEIKQAKKEKRKEKKKMEIQEVESVSEVKEEVDAAPAPAPVEEAVPEVPVVEAVPLTSAAGDTKEERNTESPKPIKPSPTKQKVKKVPTETPVSVASPKELLSIVKKTAFNDAEAQKLIDVLLTKQSGDSLNTSDEWIEKGKPTESQKLRQELNEALHMFEEEKNRNKSYSDKVAAMRKELNDERSAKSSHNKIIEEIQKKHRLEINNVNTHLQQMRQQHEILQGNMQQELHVRRNLEMNQATFQASIDGLNQQLEDAKMAAVFAKANDPHLQTELEQLRTLRDKYENTLAEINIKNTNMKKQISQQNEEIANIETKLSSSSEKVSQLATTNSGLEKALAAKTEEAKKISSDLESVKSKAVTNNNSINAAELESELDNIKQKLAEKEVEGRRLQEENERLTQQTQEMSEAGPVNGHSEPSDGGEAWREKFESLQLEHEKILAKQKVSQADRESEVCGYREQVEILKSKNNDLSAVLDQEKKSTSDLIIRLFPSLSTSSKETAVLETEAKKLVDTLTEEGGSHEKLESQVTHYKAVLAQTETMLTSLQASVEAAESDWKLKLDIANRELITLKLEKSKLSEKPSSSNEPEMQEQLTELQLKLAKEEEEKMNVTKLNQDLKQEVERLSKELVSERSQLEVVGRDFKEMETTNISLKQLVHSTQDALSKEQNLVKSFQEQLQDSKVDESLIAGPKSNTSMGSSRSNISRKSIHMQGQFYGAKLSNSGQGQQCPFPDDWTYATVPESIANDDQVD